LIVDPRRSGRRFPTGAITALAVVVVLFALREARAIVIPTLMAVFLAIAVEAPVSWLERRHVARLVAILLVVGAVASSFFLLSLILGSTLQDLTQRIPEYQDQLQNRLETFLESWGGAFGGDAAEFIDRLAPDDAIGLATSVLVSVRDLFGQTFLIVALVVFMLLEMPVLGAKLEATGSSRLTAVAVVASVRRYLGIKTITSMVTGALAGVLLSLLEISYAPLWGLLAFLLNYIPNIGSILASIPPVLLAILEGGLGLALLVLAGYLVINLSIGNFIEPRVMGEGLGLSTLVVFLSLITWGWLLGPIGMLLSAPLTATVKIACEQKSPDHPLAVLLGSGKEIAALEPVEPETAEHDA
jgi:AI-2 transport protein TqsA